KTCLVTHEETVPQTVMKPVCVDAGHWATVGRRCSLCGPKTCQTVWVSRRAQVLQPTTEMVCREVIVPETHEECHEVPTPVSFPVHTESRGFEKQEVTRHVAVTTQDRVDRQGVIRVPFGTWRCVTGARECEPASACPPQASGWDPGSGHGHPHPSGQHGGPLPAPQRPTTHPAPLPPALPEGLL